MGALFSGSAANYSPISARETPIFCAALITDTCRSTSLLYQPWLPLANIAKIVASMDLQPIDVGPLRNARHVEGLSVLLLNSSFGGGPIFEFHLRQTPQQ